MKMGDFVQPETAVVAAVVEPGAGRIADHRRDGTRMVWHRRRNFSTSALPAVLSILALLLM